MNQLAFPGLGTVMAGRRIGYYQAAVMLAGFTLTMGYMLWFLYSSVLYLANTNWNEQDWAERYRPHLWMAKWGVALCLVAWVWSLISSVQILRQARRTPPLLP
jgi:hypothetical protein